MVGSFEVSGRITTVKIYFPAQLLTLGRCID